METFPTQFGLAIGCGLTASAVMLAVWTLVQVVTGPRVKEAAGGAFEQQRLNHVRARSSIFRWFEPIVQEISRFYNPHTERMQGLNRHLKISQDRVPWTGPEFLSVKNIEAVLCAVAVYLLVAPTGYLIFAAFLAIMLLLGYTWLAETSVVKKSNRRLKRLRLRLPFAVDQIALMMQAGAEFEGSLRTVVSDNAEHPLTQELSEVLRQVALGRPRSQALHDLRSRLDDKDISELVFAINKGEELGTPLSSILRDQADQMRLKRSQWAEQAAAEAEVQMVFPGMIVMVACLLVIVAPILLPALMTFLE